MLKSSVLAALMASMAIAAPLNINLGAYSPALVVGDGEISFAGQQGAEGIVNTLQGAAAGTAGAVAEGAAIAPATEATGAQQVQGLQRSSVLSEPASLPVPGVTRDLHARKEAAEADEEEVEVDEEAEEVEKRQEGGLAKRQASGFDRALTFAEAALTKGPTVQLGTEASGVGIIVQNQPAAGAAVAAAAPAA